MEKEVKIERTVMWEKMEVARAAADEEEEEGRRLVAQEHTRTKTD